jgi:acetyl-CoA acetyltransferase
VKVTGSNSLGDHVIATSTLTIRECLMPGELSGKAAIAGIGATDFSKDSGRSELRLAAEAVLDALDDAGLTPADVDGMVTFTMDSNTEVAVARAAGIGDLKFFSKIHHGGGAACATVQQAAIAVATGVADCVWRIGLSTSVPVCGSARCSCG